MKKFISGVAILISAVSIAGCNPYHQNEEAGTVGGAIAGGLLGSLIGGGAGQVIAIGVGAVGGALIGNSIGRSMDEQNNYNSDYYYTNTNRGYYYRDGYYQNGYYHRGYYYRYPSDDGYYDEYDRY